MAKNFSGRMFIAMKFLLLYRSPDLATIGRITKIICVYTKEVFFFVEYLTTYGIGEHVDAYSFEHDPLGGRVLIAQHITEHFKLKSFSSSGI